MSCWLFKAMTRNPQTGQQFALPAGCIDSFVLNVPGNMTYANAQQKQMAMNFAIAEAKRMNLGTPQKCRYAIILIEPDTDQTEVLCIQPYYGPGAAVQAGQPVTSAAHVNGGQPTGVPVGSGQNRQEGPRDVSSGFQDLPDAALAGVGDNMYGAMDDGTQTDILAGGFGSVEVQRQ